VSDEREPAADGPRPWPFSHSDEVRFSDLDVLEHLNNVAFLVFLESTRVAYVRSRVPAGQPLIPAGHGMVVAETLINYRSPGHLGDRIDTLLRPDEVGRSSFRVEFEMRVGERVIADGHSVMVYYNRDAGRPAPLPEPMRRRLIEDGAVERPAAAAALTKL
jgi:acyl-CoA thioester hydrolase